MKASVRAGVGVLIPFLPVSCSFCGSVWRSAGVLSYVFIPNPSLSICLFLARILGFISPCTWKSPNNTESSSGALSLLSGGLGGKGKLKRTDSSGFWIPSLARKSGSIFPKEWGCWREQTLRVQVCSLTSSFHFSLSLGIFFHELYPEQGFFWCKFVLETH